MIKCKIKRSEGTSLVTLNSSSHYKITFPDEVLLIVRPESDGRIRLEI